jgi:putative transposase
MNHLVQAIYFQKDPAAYPWSSAAAHLAGRDDELVKVEPLLEMIGNSRALLL